MSARYLNGGHEYSEFLERLHNGQGWHEQCLADDLPALRLLWWDAVRRGERMPVDATILIRGDKI